MRFSLEERKLRQFIIEVLDANLYEIALDDSRRSISLSEVEALFKYFHVSKKKLNDNEPFVFNPRIPNRPYKHQGYVIEDDFTQRISLASKVTEAAEAVMAEDGDVYWVYAADIHSVADDDLDVVSLQVTLQKCKDFLDSEDNQYGREYDFGKFLMKHSKKPELRKVVKKTRKEVGYTGKYHPEDTKDLINSPSELPSKLRKQWFACVPDAEDTNEFWSLENTKMYLLGSYTAYSDYLDLTDEGLRLIQSCRPSGLGAEGLG